MILMRVFIALVTSLALIAPASAASINWGAAQDVSGAADVNNSQVTIEAVNLTPDSGVPGSTTVNGVTFTHDNTLMGLAGGNGLMTSDTGDAGLNNLMNSVDHGACDGCAWTIQVGGGNLVAGNQYDIQLFYSDNRGFAGASWGQNYDDGAGNSVNLNANGANRHGQHVTGTFTADGTTQTLSITGGGPPGEPHLNAYQIRGVPEPTTLVLAGLGLVSLGFVGRRRNRS